MNPIGFLPQRLDDVPARTSRGNEILRHDTRELPRRLRGVLLSIDGRQTARTYIDKLGVFGDVGALLDELMALGLVELRSGPRKRKLPIDIEAADGDSRFLDSTGASSSGASGFAPLETLMDDPPRLIHVLTDSTLPGSFDDMVRVARSDNRDWQPPAPAPAPTAAELPRQIEGLFNLLEAARGERQALRERVARLRKYRDGYERLRRENQRLAGGVHLLTLACAVLVAVLLVVVIRR